MILIMCRVSSVLKCRCGGDVDMITGKCLKCGNQCVSMKGKCSISMTDSDGNVTMLRSRNDISVRME